MWRTQDLDHKDYEGIDPFMSRDSAALFLSMQRRSFQVDIPGEIFPSEPAKITIGPAYQVTILGEIPTEPSKITIRVLPNLFGNCVRCKRGQWAAIFYDAHGQEPDVTALTLAIRQRWRAY